MKRMIKKATAIILTLIIAAAFTANAAAADTNTAASSAAVTIYTKGLNSKNGLRMGSRSMTKVLGMDYNKYLNWLDTHDKDSANPGYYVGTRYSAGDCRNPNGDCKTPYGHLNTRGVPGSNCTGFVWHVLYKSCDGGSFCGNHMGGRCQYKTSTGIILPTLFGSDGTGWYNFYNSNDIERYYFSTKSAMLNSGVLEKGDIIWQYVGQGESEFSNSHHIGIYYGNGKSDLFWHCTTPGNNITEIRNIVKTSVYCVLKMVASKDKTPKSVSLSRTKATRGVGDVYQLKATVSPSYAKTSYTWTSSNNKVVSVDKNGKITPKKPGTAVITVKTKNGKTARCNVTVRNAPNSISLSRNKATRGAGDSYQLTATLPKGTMGTYQWSSSNNKVVSVDKNGKINPIKAGKATITVKTYNGKTASCNVTVRNAPSYVKLSRSKATRGAGDSYQLTTKLPANSMATFKWSSSDKSIVSVDKNGKINPIKAGKATITVKTYNGKTASCNVTVKNAPSYVKLNRDTATRDIGDSYQLKTSLPKNTMATFTWSSSDESIVSVDKNGLITPLASGTAVITVMTYNGMTASCTVRVR